MDFIKAKNNGCSMDVIFDGRFIFIDKLHGLVAIAESVQDEDFNLTGYHIERTLAIGMSVIKRTITRYLYDAYDRIHDGNYRPELTFTDCTVHRFVGSLPYGITIGISK